MNMQKSHPWRPDSSLDSLIDRFLSGQIEQHDVDRLEALLAGDPDARGRFRSAASLDAALREWAAVAGVSDAWASLPAEESVRASARRGVPSKLAAAVALGVVAGLISSTLIFAATTPGSGSRRAIQLVDLAFRHDAPPDHDGIPHTFNVWGGDFCRLVGIDQGVRPPGAAPMLRMLRSDNSNSPPGATSSHGEVWRFIDLQPLRHRLGRRVARVELTAFVNSAPVSDFERVQFSLGLHAFAGHSPAEVATLWNDLWKNTKDDNGSVTSYVGTQIGDDDSTTWQKIDVVAVIPPEATVLLVHATVVRPSASSGSSGPVEFPGQYFADMAFHLMPAGVDDDQ